MRWQHHPHGSAGLPDPLALCRGPPTWLSVRAAYPWDTHWAGSSCLPSLERQSCPLKPRRKQPCLWAVVGVAALWWSLKHPQRHSSLSLKNSALSQLNSSVVQSCRIQEVQQPSFIPPSFLCLCSSDWQCLCWYNLISISSFCWDGRLSPWVTLQPLYQTCSVTPSVSSLEQTFSSLAMWLGWEFSKSSSSGSFLLNNCFSVPLHFPTSNWAETNHSFL